MKSKATRRFWRLFHLFQKDPSDPELHFKQVVPSSNYWSIRFGDARRAIGVRTGADIDWIWIGDHTEYEQIIHGTRR